MSNMWGNDQKDSSSQRRPYENSRGGSDRPKSSFSGGERSGGFRSDRGGFSNNRGGSSFGGDRRGGSNGGFKKPEQIITFELLKGAKVPRYMTEESTGADIIYPHTVELIIQPEEIVKVSTGLVIKSMPNRLEIQIRSRSNLAAKGLLLLGPTSLSLEDKEKEIHLHFINLSKEPMIIKHEERICQFVFSFVQRVQFELNRTLSQTDRNEGGFGSTNHNN
jgi:dUTP pyrophosphatase